MKRQFRWIALNGTVLLLTVLCTIYDVAGSMNILTAYIFISFIASLFILYVKECRSAWVKIDLPVPMWVNNTVDLTVSCLLLWFDHTFIGSMYLVQCGILAATKNNKIEDEML